MTLNKTLLDTDTYSEILKSKDPIVTQNALLYRRVHNVLTLSAVTLMEIVIGLQQNQAKRRLPVFLSAVAAEEILTFDPPAAELAGRIGGDLRRAGRIIGLADTMIAAIAIHNGLDLATGNTSHFQFVRQIGYPLTVVNWRK